jgi:hypothetical protein
MEEDTVQRTRRYCGKDRGYALPALSEHHWILGNSIARERSGFRFRNLMHEVKGVLAKTRHRSEFALHIVS